MTWKSELSYTFLQQKFQFEEQITHKKSRTISHEILLFSNEI